MFYIYAYIRQNGTPYYIGKGHGNRAWSKHRYNLTPKQKERIVIMETELTELGAFALERRYIRWWGRKDIGTGILVNRTDGGEGQRGRKVPEYIKEYYSNLYKGRKAPIISQQVRKKHGKFMIGNQYAKGKPRPDLNKKITCCLHCKNEYSIGQLTNHLKSFVDKT